MIATAVGGGAGANTAAAATQGVRADPRQADPRIHSGHGQRKAARSRRVVYHYSFARHKRDDRAINAMVDRAEKVADGTRPLKKDRFVQLVPTRALRPRTYGTHRQECDRRQPDDATMEPRLVAGHNRQVSSRPAAPLRACWLVEAGHVDHDAAVDVAAAQCEVVDPEDRNSGDLHVRKIPE
jgi:hypothetical protein